MKQNFVPNYPVVMVEREYDGSFERFALTDIEFFQKYGLEDYGIALPAPSRKLNSFTISRKYTHAITVQQPRVVIRYKLAYIGSDEWNAFFTDMTYGLPEKDVANKNFAYIRTDLMESLTSYCRHVDEKPSDVRTLHLAIGTLSAPEGEFAAVRVLPTNYWADKFLLNRIKAEFATQFACDTEDFGFACHVIAVPVDVTTIAQGGVADA